MDHRLVSYKRVVFKDGNLYIKLALDDKNISFLMSVKPEGLLGNIKMAHFFHHPVQA